MMRRPLSFQDIPRLFQALDKHGYRPVSSIGESMLRCDHNGESCIVKASTPSEELIYTRVLPQIHDQKPGFRHLVLPEAREVLKLERGRNLLVLRDYPGQTFNKAWSEHRPGELGGRGISVNLAKKSIGMLSDLRKIPVSSLKDFGLLRFDTTRWQKENLPVILRDLRKAGHLSTGQCAELDGELSSPALFRDSAEIIANGDFYPRNFILLSNNKVVLIDWEARTEKQNRGRKAQGMRNALIAPAELHVAFLSIHMWGNTSFRRTLHEAAYRSLHLRKASLRSALVIRGLEQAHFWREKGSYLARRPLDCIFEALDG